jgi:hypothetical protein
MSESKRDEEVVGLRTVLADDESGEATRALIQSLREAGAPLSAALRGTLSQEEYRLSDDLLQALQTAEQVLKRVWERMHADRQLVC